MNVNLALNKEDFFNRYGRAKYVSIYTLGCKVNQYDTEAVAEQFKERGYEVVPFKEIADIYIVNTCTVTHLSDRKCRQILRKTKKINPFSILVAMGCYAQAVSDKIQDEVTEVDIVIGTNRRKELIDIVENFSISNHGTNNELITNYVDNIMEIAEFEELTISQMSEHTRVYLKIQEGCNNYCTYCIIPYVRGKIRSRKEDNVIKEASRLAINNFKEIVLTGIHVASYGKDLSNVSLNTLLPKLNNVDGIERIRMSSIEPIVVTNEFVNMLVTTKKMCQHFHLSLQSGSNSVLNRMKRRYTTQQYFDSVMILRNLWPDIAITTDIIVGFPGETEQEFLETLEFVQKVGFSQIHIFPYSNREGTIASKMSEQISSQIKDERVKRLAQIEAKLRYAFLDRECGKIVEVLFETSQNGISTGYTSNYLKVEVATDEILTNKINKVSIDKRVGDVLSATLIK
ncbi:MAG: tRNA (N(6)-L-threonylcarbamoyladenosine(37)-C(2))-methylthiotransferase MtaB [Epulopiscium sp. Nele67-Bin002]|nr:MAG: tRNA (N(6)-L-threonylcarbamoyladenosine(37)-C(2))-methylthiotransferase MtaB [Epulopiscium sp. Nuni2H_MBin001]OON92740.1 MAG: tRNA (N(6)-L-threonylcarbamoyladenosine(37)-C(2))-methylthiotransferase MtaB [Epulopiscium sp. Nele67-Bin002]